MNICYIDESGTPEVPGTSSHFVLAGLSIPVDRWRSTDSQITGILSRYALADAELHTAWLVRKYIEQSRIPNFDRLDYASRKSAVDRARADTLLNLQRKNQKSQYRQTKKTYAHTLPYIHLTLVERQRLVADIAAVIAGWEFATLFAECIDKIHFDPVRTRRTVEEQGFEQVVSRFEQYLVKDGSGSHGILVHDNNDTVARKHTRMMRSFHASGTLWTKVTRIAETPLFVNSELTRMVQIADLCSYALRRYVENAEDEPFKTIFARAHKSGDTVVGVRHYTNNTCACHICVSHSRQRRRLVRAVPGISK